MRSEGVDNRARCRCGDRDLAEPGRRVLNIVGASHKPWFDALLGMTQGVEMVDAEQVLR